MAVKFSRDTLKSTTKTMGDFNLSNRFTVEVDGKFVGGIHKVEGLEHENETVEYQDGDGHMTHLRPGKQKTSTIRFERDWSSTDEFYSWFKTVLDGRVERKSISIVFLNDAGEEASRINIYDAFPKKWIIQGLNSKSSGHASEVIEVVYERIAYA